jgi:phosphatidate cytidylyltransferase
MTFYISVVWALIFLVIITFLIWGWEQLSKTSPELTGLTFVRGISSIGCMGVGLVWLRETGDGGFLVVLWLMVTIWMTDICAFFSGRFFQGPKMAPAISPNKTWSGLIGGVLGAALWSCVWSEYTGIGSLMQLGIIGGGTALLAQFGDLSVSVVKRRFGVKDTGSIIPGHGGLLDRMDGFLVAVPIVAISLAISRGYLS